MTAETGRVYGGRSEHERRADRRERLLAAGLDVYGTDGWAGATIERLCSAAAVATRSFYEEFTSRETLLLAVYEDIMSGVVRNVLPKVQASDGSVEEKIRIGLAGYVGYLTEDPRRARVAHKEIRTAGVLESDRAAMVARFGEIITSQAQLPSGAQARLLGLALTGAVSECLVDWVAHPEPRPDTAPIVDTLVDIYVAVITPLV